MHFDHFVQDPVPPDLAHSFPKQMRAAWIAPRALLVLSRRFDVAHAGIVPRRLPPCPSTQLWLRCLDQYRPLGVYLPFCCGRDTTACRASASKVIPPRAALVVAVW